MGTVGVDIFTFNNRNYLMTVDYFSIFWEIDLSQNIKVKTVIRRMKAQFARFGVPDVRMSDNGPQFVPKILDEYIVIKISPAQRLRRKYSPSSETSNKEGDEK